MALISFSNILWYDNKVKPEYYAFFWLIDWFSATLYQSIGVILLAFFSILKVLVPENDNFFTIRLVYRLGGRIARGNILGGRALL